MAAARPRRPGRPAARRCPARPACGSSGEGRTAAAAPSVGRRGVALPRQVRSSASDVDDDLAAARGEDPDERPDRGHVELAVRPAVDEEDLGAARAVDVADRPQLGAVDAADGRADDLVPEVLAAAELRLGPGDPLEVRAAELVGGLAGRDLRRSAAASLDRRRRPTTRPRSAASSLPSR